MKAEVELPPLADNWADGNVEIKYGVPPRGSLYLWCGEWVATKPEIPTSSWIYAVRKWVPKIVTAGVLEPGWIVIDPDGAYWYSYSEPVFDESALEWAGGTLDRLYIKEAPSIAGRNAIWQIK